MESYVKGEVFECKSGTTTVYHPVLTDEERAIRHDELYQAAVRFLKAVERLRMQIEKTG